MGQILDDIYESLVFLHVIMTLHFEEAHLIFSEMYAKDFRSKMS